MSENQVTKTSKKAVAIPKELLGSFMEDAGAGTENISADDMKIPFIRVIQPTSPEVKKKDDRYIHGAQAGQMFNTVTRQIWEDEVIVIPCGYIKKYLEFVPREKGGGFKGELDPNSPEVLGAVRDKGTNKDMMKNGNELVISAQHYCKIRDPESGSWQSAIIDMKSTNLKISRQWNTMIQMQEHTADGKTFKIPSFGVIWRLESDEVSNDKGTWNAWKIGGREGYVDNPDLYKSCKELSEMVADGTAQAEADPDLVAPANDGEPIPF